LKPFVNFMLVTITFGSFFSKTVLFVFSFLLKAILPTLKVNVAFFCLSFSKTSVVLALVELPTCEERFPSPPYPALLFYGLDWPEAYPSLRISLSRSFLPRWNLLILNCLKYGLKLSGKNGTYKFFIILSWLYLAWIIVETDATCSFFLKMCLISTEIASFPFMSFNSLGGL